MPGLPSVALGLVLLLPVIVQAQGAGGRSVTQGIATRIVDNLFVCGEKVSNHRISAVGRITSQRSEEHRLTPVTLESRMPSSA